MALVESRITPSVVEFVRIVDELAARAEGKPGAMPGQRTFPRS
jgi:hypothetical protein